MRASSIPLSEYNPYYERYIASVGDIPLLDALQKGLAETSEFFNQLPDGKWSHRYQEGKWTPKDILMHIADTERVFAYRALYFARSSNSVLKGFDENIFAITAEANELKADRLITNFRAVRLATLSLFQDFNEFQLKQLGEANGSILSVRAAGFIICGHEIHHRNIISERYL